MATPPLKTIVRVIGKDIVDQKLRMAFPHILENNTAMVTGMLEYIRPLVAAQTPLGPGHFGYHLRDSYKIDVAFKPPVSTVGVLKAPAQGYWREFGTKGRSRKRASALRGSHSTLGLVTSRTLLVSYGGHGERAFMTAHKTLSAARRMMNFYYGGLAKWWRV